MGFFETSRTTRPALSRVRDGAASISRNEAELNALRRLLQSLQLRILDVIARLDELHEDPDYELHRLCVEGTVTLEEIVDGMVSEIRAEITELEAEAESLRKEIDALTGGEVIGED